jgi:hypothetical protein
MIIFKNFNSNLKNENFQFFHFKLSWHISFFPFPSGGMAKCSTQISKSIFFLFSIPLGWHGYIFFQNSKKYSIQILKIFFRNFPCGIKKIAAQGGQIYLKNCKS